MNTVITAAAYAVAISVARTPYQRGLIDGMHYWSGNDLTGKARRYGSDYAASRARLIRACQEAKLRVVVSPIGERRRLVAAIATKAEAQRIRATPEGGDVCVEGRALRRRIENIAARAVAKERRERALDEAALAGLR